MARFILDNTSTKTVDHAANRSASFYGNSKAARAELQDKSSFGDLATSDGRGVVLKGGMSSSAFFGERGASGAMNALLAMPVKGKAGKWQIACPCLSDLLDLCIANGSTDPMGKVQQHLSSMVKEADPARLAANGIRLALRKAGFTTIPPAVLFDGKTWDGRLFKRSTTAATKVACPLLAVLRFILNEQELPACLKPEAFTD